MLSGKTLLFINIKQTAVDALLRQPPAKPAFPPDTKKDAANERLFNQNGGEREPLSKNAFNTAFLSARSLEHLVERGCDNSRCETRCLRHNPVK